MSTNNLENTDKIQNIFIGLIHFSSKYTYTSDSKQTIYKECTIFAKLKYKILVKSKKINEKNDTYAIIRVEKLVDNILFCCVNEYLSDFNKPKSTLRKKLFIQS